mgnify:CR=1 FL=1
MRACSIACNVVHDVPETDGLRGWGCLTLIGRLPIEDQPTDHVVWNEVRVGSYDGHCDWTSGFSFS